MNIIPMRPFSKARPRRHAKQTFMPLAYRQAKATCAAALRCMRLPCAAGNVSLTLVFQYRKGPWSDVDNLAGGFMDAANGILWQDDKQVSILHVERVKGAADEIQFTVEELE